MKSFNFKYAYSLVIILGLFVSACNTETTEPVSINKIEYQPTQKESAEQSDLMVEETMGIVSEMIMKQSFIKNSTSSLAKSTDSEDYYYFDGMHIWRGDIARPAFGYEDAYEAEYLAKLGFLDANGNDQFWPAGSNKMMGSLKAHSAFGFVEGLPYGDEVWYDFQGMVTPTTAFPSIVNIQGDYERRWAGVYNGEDTELHYMIRLQALGLKYYYRFADNDFWLDGTINVQVGMYNTVIRFNNSRNAYIKVYKDGVMVQTYMKELPNFYEMYNIPGLNDAVNVDFGEFFSFPTPIDMPL